MSITSALVSCDHVGPGDVGLKVHAVPDVPGHAVHEPACGMATGRTWSERKGATRLFRDLDEIIGCNRKASELADHFHVAGLMMYETLLRLRGPDPFILPVIVGNLMAEFPYMAVRLSANPIYYSSSRRP